MSHFKIILFLIISSILYAKPINIDHNTNFINLLSNSEIYIDKSKNLSITEIREKTNEFVENNKKHLSYGYAPDFNIWVKFSLHNNTDKIVKKILEYENSLTTHIHFFDPQKNNVQKEGFLQKRKDRKTINPIFQIEIKPKETVTYYVKVSSYITTVIIKLNLWEKNDFLKKELKHQIFLSLFFGAMFILGVYNLFIYFFTKDVSYFYYVIYIFGVIFHHLMYVGFVTIYLTDDNDIIKIIIDSAPLIVALPILALGFFTKSFLQTEQYPKNNIVLNTFLILIPISIIFFLLTDEYDSFRNTLTMLFLIYLMTLTLYATMKKNKQAYLILFAWFIFLASGMVMYLSSAGIFSIDEYLPYFVETSFILEAIVFSIALAKRINNLQKEKEEANKQLLEHQKNETKKLSKKVKEKTKDLRKTLDEKSLLLKELNHRVKNNMQTIVSLIRLQSDEIYDDKLQDILVTIQNRINAMSHLHELLYSQDDISHINAYEYFDILIEEVKYSYEREIKFHLDVQTELEMEQAIYCGLILNELITNSFKYAFPEEDGNIYIKLSKNENKLTLNVIDDGIGYKNEISTSSIGLLLVETLTKEQLDGDIEIDSSNGTNTFIRWETNAKS